MEKLSNFREEWQRELQGVIHPHDLVVEFGEIFSKARYQSFVFVEGPTDEIFYTHTNRSELNKDAYYQCGSLTKERFYEGKVGKDAVLYSLNRIVNDSKLSKSLHKCIFIIDRDFDDTFSKETLPKCKNTEYTLYETKGHSVENYLFEEKNIGHVLRYINFQCNVNDFLDKFKDFTKEMSTYYAVNSEITRQSQNNAFYKHRYSLEEILSFNFSKEDFWIGRQKAREEIKLMQDVVLGNQWSKGFVENKQRLIEKNIMLIRGHDAFTFLYQYAKQKYNKDFDIFEKRSDYHDLIDVLSVDFERVYPN